MSKHLYFSIPSYVANSEIRCSVCGTLNTEHLKLNERIPTIKYNYNFIVF